MKNSKEKKLEKEQRTPETAGKTKKKGELSENELEQVSGGLNPQPLPPSPPPELKRF